MPTQMPRNGRARARHRLARARFDSRAPPRARAGNRRRRRRPGSTIRSAPATASGALVTLISAAMPSSRSRALERLCRRAQIARAVIDDRDDHARPRTAGRASGRRGLRWRRSRGGARGQRSISRDQRVRAIAPGDHARAAAITASSAARRADVMRRDAARGWRSRAQRAPRERIDGRGSSTPRPTTSMASATQRRAPQTVRDSAQSGANKKRRPQRSPQRTRHERAAKPAPLRGRSHDIARKSRRPSPTRSAWP